MANLSNINNKLLVGTNGEVRIGDTATVANVKLRVKQTAQQWTAQFVNTDSSVAYGISIDTSASSYGVAGTLQCYTNAGGGFIVRNDSRVGIGTASPGSKLDVRGSGYFLGTASSGVALVTIENNSGSTATSYGLLVLGGGNSSNGRTFEVRDASGNTDLIVKGDGNVGIGTSSPDTLLHIYNPDTNWGAYSVITLGTDVEGTNQAQLKYYRGASTSTESFQLSVRGTTALTALYNGNVGIGTTSPGEKLEVAGNVGVNGFITHNGDSGTFMGWSADDTNVFYTAGNERLRIDASGVVKISNTADAILTITSGTTNTAKINFGDSSNDDAGIIAYTNDAGGSDTMAFTVGTSEKMRIINSGNIGIGTTGPLTKLDVRGSTFVSGYLAGFDTSPQGNYAYRLTNDGANSFINVLGGNLGIGTTSPGRGLTIDKSNQYAALEIIKNNTTNQIVYLGTGSSAGTDDPILQLKHNGTENIRLYATGNSWINGGNVGIGTTSPAQPVHLLNGGFAYMRFTSQGYGATGFDIGQHTNGNIYLNNRDNTAMVFMTNNAERMNILAGGTGTFYNAFSIQGDDKSLIVRNAAGTVIGTMGAESSSTPNVGMTTIRNNGTTTIQFNSNGSSYINGGNVGIGTTTNINAPLTVQSNGGGSAINIIGRNNGTADESIIDFYQNDGTTRMAYMLADDGNLDFATGGSTVRMRITSGGLINMGNQAGSGAGRLNISANPSNNYQIEFFTSAGTSVGTITTSGGTTTNYNTTSDYRLKEDLQDFNGLDKVSKIPVYNFKWKTDESRSYGVMAHELQEVLPQAVSGDKDAEEMQSVDYSKIVPLLVKSIQELKAEIKLLKSK